MSIVSKLKQGLRNSYKELEDNYGEAICGTVLSFILFALVFWASLPYIRGNFFPPKYAVVKGQVIKSYASKPWKRSINSAEPYIEYIYSVRGVNYRGTQIGFAHEEPWTKQKVKSLLKKYPVNSRVKVFYDPENPSFSALEPDNTDGLINWPFFSNGCFFLLFLYFAIGTWYARKAKVAKQDATRAAAQ
jgi:hypothetical protein